MAASKWGRFLAPIALAAVIAAIYVLVHRELGTTHAATHTSSAVLPSTTTGTHNTTRRSRPAPRVYIVKSGDTLSGIAVKTHVSLGVLESLNPSTQSGTLQPGQRLLLRR
jgi:LysM repeat protein